MERNPGGRPRHPDILTPAEWRVLAELRKGGTNVEIAVRLGISPDAVKYHISNMLGKLGLANRHELAAWRLEDRGTRRLAFLALPAWVASLGRPLLWVGGGLVAAGVATVIALVSIAAFGEGDDRPHGLRTTEDVDKGAIIDRADVHYVSKLCLAFSRLRADGETAAERWGVHTETWGEDFRNIPGDQLGDFAAEVFVAPWKRHGTELEGISAPPGVEEFHAAAVGHRVARIEALSPLLDHFPTESDPEGPSAIYAYGRLLAGIGEITVNVPSASVELRRRLWAATSEASECADPTPLEVFLGGGKPTLEPSAADRRYLAALCTGGSAFTAWMVQILPDLNGDQTPERRARLLSDYVDSLEELRAAIETAPPPDDVAEHHLEFLEVIDENIAFYAGLQESETEDDADPPDVSLEQITRLQRLFNTTGDPIAPPEARERLLESANSVEECGGTAFPRIFLGTEEE